jgi:hypothetical protein
MSIFKKTVFFILFFIGVFQVMGNAISGFEQKSFATECQEGNQTDSSYSFTLESDDCEDENLEKMHACLAGIIIEKDHFHQKKYDFYPSFFCAFWQPPRFNG